MGLWLNEEKPFEQRYRYIKNTSNIMDSQTKKITVKCLMCDEEITEPLSSSFAELHIASNPGHLEYRVTLEMPSSNVPDNQPTLVFDDKKEH